MPDKKISVRIGRDEAVVLFEMLAKFTRQKALSVRDEAERLALFRLHGALESTLTEPFRPEYKQLVDESRSRLLLQSKVQSN